MTKLSELTEFGQAVWFDYIRRSFTRSGDLQALIDQGVRGVTSNPAIFEKAIAGSDDYDDDIRRLVGERKSVNEIYEALALEDIRQAADLLLPLYDRTDGLDGYVSLEVSPTLAHDTSGTVADAKRLFAATDRPNLMIKIPATPAGIPAIETVIAAGISVNVTLIFSLAQYEAAAVAYINGLGKLMAAGGALGQTASVASFFVSRVDTAVDTALPHTVAWLNGQQDNFLLVNREELQRDRAHYLRCAELARAAGCVHREDIFAARLAEFAAGPWPPHP